MRDRRRSRCCSTRCSASDSLRSSPAGCFSSTGSRSERRSRRKSRRAAIGARPSSDGSSSSPSSPRSRTGASRVGILRRSSRRRGAAVRRRPIVPTTPDQEPSVVYEPSMSWIPIAIVVGLVVAAVIAYFVAERRSRSGDAAVRNSRRNSPSCWTRRSTTSAPRPTRVVRSSQRTREWNACWPPTASRGDLRRRRTSTSRAFSAISRSAPTRSHA